MEEKKAVQTPQSKSEIVCSDDDAPVCGKDNKTYANKCIAEKIKEVEVSHDWTCENNKKSESSQSWTELWESNLWETTESWSTENTATWEEIKVKKIESISKKPDANYYKNLKSQCWNDSCCISSVDNMESSGYMEAEDGKCEFWFSSNTLKCSWSYKWCEKNEETTNQTESSSEKTADSTATWSNTSWTFNWQKVLNYYNSSLKYWFSVPSNSYFSWYWSQWWSTHSVGINTSSWSSTYWDSAVKVSFFKWKVLPELQDSHYWMYEDKTNWITYIELDWNSVVIDYWKNSKIADLIVKTIHAEK